MKVSSRRGPAVEIACRRLRALGVSLCLALALVAAGTAAGRTRAQPPVVVLPESAAMRSLPRDAPVARHSYGWPVRPFGRQHAIRGGFGDPRFGRVQRNFHFGIDIPAAPLTPVYAVASGTVFLEPDHVDVLNRRQRWRSGFSYWHIFAAVGEHVFVRKHELLGWVRPAWGHLHFSELLNNRYVNPLRRGALEPYSVPTRPRLEAPTILPHVGIDPGAPPGRDPVDVTVDAWTTSALRPPSPWQRSRVAPSLIRWRLLQRGVPVSRWRTAVDFREFIPPNRLFGDVYAPGTAQNTRYGPGTYRFYLARDWNLYELPPGKYDLQVEAFGSRGAIATAATQLSVGD